MRPFGHAHRRPTPEPVVEQLGFYHIIPTFYPTIADKDADNPSEVFNVSQNVTTDGTRLLMGIASGDRFHPVEENHVMSSLMYSDDGCLFRACTLPERLRLDYTFGSLNGFGYLFAGDPFEGRWTATACDSSIGLPLYSDDGITFVEGSFNNTGHPDYALSDMDFFGFGDYCISTRVGNYWFIQNGPGSFGNLQLHVSTDGAEWFTPDAWRIDGSMDASNFGCTTMFGYIPTIGRYLFFHEESFIYDELGGWGGYAYSNEALTTFTNAPYASGTQILDAFGVAPEDYEFPVFSCSGIAWAGDRLIVVFTCFGFPAFAQGQYAYSKVFSTTDGLDWTLVNGDNPFQHEVNDGFADSLTSQNDGGADPLPSRLRWDEATDTLYYGEGAYGDEMSYFKSTDKGLTWEKINLGVFGTDDTTYVSFYGTCDALDMGEYQIVSGWGEPTPTYSNAPIPTPDVTADPVEVAFVPGETTIGTATVSGVGTNWSMLVIRIDVTGDAGVPDINYENNGLISWSSVQVPFDFPQLYMADISYFSARTILFQIENVDGNLNADGEYEFRTAGPLFGEVKAQTYTFTPMFYS